MAIHYNLVFVSHLALPAHPLLVVLQFAKSFIVKLPAAVNLIQPSVLAVKNSVVMAEPLLVLLQALYFLAVPPLCLAPILNVA